MKITDKLMAEEFKRRWGQPPRPQAQDLNNYGCCDQCRSRCEALANVDLKSPESGVNAFDPKMGFEAFAFIMPHVPFQAFKKDRRFSGTFSILPNALSQDFFPQLNPEQRTALKMLLEYSRASDFGDLDDRRKLSEAINALEELEQHGRYLD